MIFPSRRRHKPLSVQTAGLIRYLPLDDLASGTVRDLSPLRATDATYSAGLTYGAAGRGNGRTAITFSGTDTHIVLGSAAFATAWNGDTGSAIIWAKNTGIWSTDSTFRFLYHIRAEADATYYIRMGKSTVANTLVWQRRSGGVIVELTTVASTTDWFCLGMTWDIATQTIKAYMDGELIGTNAANVNYTAWGANPPNNNMTVLYAANTTLQEWVGDGGGMATWAGVVLSDAEMRYLARR